MGTDRQAIFNAFMEEFVKLNKIDKNNEIIEKEKRIIAYLMAYLEENEIPYEMFKSKEINDILNEGSTDDDYLEAMMVYLQNVEELTGTLMNKN